MVTPHASFQAESFLRDVLGADHIQPSGDELIHSCLLPFDLHPNGDRNPSASLNAEKLVYNCFTCGGGNLLWATESILKISAAQARDLIQLNLSPANITKETFLQELEAVWRGNEATSLPHLSTKIIERWACYTKYMDERGISHEVQKEMKTGVNLMQTEPIAGQQIQQPRLVIPHMFKGELVGWTMRKLSDTQLGPKYRHTEQFPKRETLYNYDNVRGQEAVIVVESPMSVLWLKSCGYHNVVATFGAEVNERQLELLQGFKSVTLFPDGDQAGYASMQRWDKRGNDVGTIQALSAFVSVHIVDHGVDPNDGDPRWNDKDAADYDKEELVMMFKARTPAMLWRWPNGVQKVDQSKVRKGTGQPQ